MAFYKILKVLNNNSLLVSDGYHESIIIGHGIGFKRKPNDEFDQEILVEKKFHLLKDIDYQNQSQVPKNVIINTAKIVDIVNEVIQSDISEKATISLTNHIAAMLVRIEHGQIFPNPFHHETITLYEQSYLVALHITSRIHDEIGITIPEGEVDFLTLYVHQIRSGEDRGNFEIRNAIISEISEVLQDDLGIEFDKASTVYARFITHIKFLILRLNKNEPITSVPLVKSIAEQYPEYFEMSIPVAAVLSRQLNRELNIDEQAYIALHLARLTLK